VTSGRYTGWIISYNETIFSAAISVNVTPTEKKARSGRQGRDRRGLERKYLLSRCEWNVRYDAECQWFSRKWRLRERDHRSLYQEWSPGRGGLLQHVNTVSESNADQDLGSGGAMVVPTFKDSSGVIHALVVGAGKRIPNIYLANRSKHGEV